jgi:hypothetical protein
LQLTAQFVPGALQRQRAIPVFLAAGARSQYNSLADQGSSFEYKVSQS